MMDDGCAASCARREGAEEETLYIEWARRGTGLKVSLQALLEALLLRRAYVPYPVRYPLLVRGASLALGGRAREVAARHGREPEPV